MTIKNLKDLRESKGIKQKFVYETLEISRQTLIKKETKLSPVSVAEANLLSKIYGVDVNTIRKLAREY